MDTDNLRITMTQRKHGPYYSRSECIRQAQADPDCIAFQSFDLIKSRSTGLYDYSSAGVLMSDDTLQAHYYLNFRNEWRHICRRTK